MTISLKIEIFKAFKFEFDFSFEKISKEKESTPVKDAETPE